MQYPVFGDQPQVDCFQSLETVLSAKNAKSPLLPFFPLSANILAIKPKILPTKCLNVNYFKLIWTSETHKSKFQKKCFGSSLTFCAETKNLG